MICVSACVAGLDMYYVCRSCAKKLSLFAGEALVGLCDLSVDNLSVDDLSVDGLSEVWNVCCL